MGGLSNQFSLHHPDFRPRNPDRHHSDVLHWMNSLKGIRCRDSQNKTRVQIDDRGLLLDCVRSNPVSAQDTGAQFTLYHHRNDGQRPYPDIPAVTVRR